MSGASSASRRDPAHVALGDILGVADLTDRRVEALIEHALPTPRARQRLDQRAVGLRLGRPRDLTAVGGDDPLAAATALKPDWDTDG